jgi:hypothetical protein
VRGDEERVVRAFCTWLETDGWTVERELKYCDVVARRGEELMFAEAKGRTSDAGLDTDTMYGQLLRRIPRDGLDHRLGVVVPSSAVKAALRVDRAVRDRLGITIYEVTDDDRVVVIGG